MANSYIGARSPKGDVGVRGVLDAGELSAYSAGVLSGFAAASATSWTLSIGGVSGTQDVCVAKNPAGESELLGGTAGQSIDFIIGGAPGTPGQSRTDALVIYKDPFTTSTVNDGIDIVDYQVVAGTAATTGSQVPPDDTAIRAAIPTGSLKFVSVIGYVTIAYGASGVTTGNHVLNRSRLNPLLHTIVVANQTERDNLSAFEGLEVYRSDTDATEIYDGSAWLSFDSKWQSFTPTWKQGTTNWSSLGTGATNIGKYKRSGKQVDFYAKLILGTSVSIGGTGLIGISAPIANLVTDSLHGQAYLNDLAPATRNYHLRSVSTDIVTAVSESDAAVNNTTPWTWAVGDTIRFAGSYEIS